MKSLDQVRAEFPILDQTIYGNKPLIYLDSGATAQKPRRVIDCVNRLHTQMNANIHRGVHFMSQEVTAEFEAAREEVRRFIGAEHREEIIFTSGATAGVNTVAYSWGEKFLSAGDNIIVSEMEHHSNIVPWQLIAERKGAHIKVLPFDDEGRLMEEKLEDLIDDKTRLIAVTQASNTLGTRPNLQYIIDAAKEKGIATLIDGCQGVVHGGVDVAALGCDFYVFSGHKLYGPTGIGVLYGRKEILEQMPPFLGGGDMVDRVSFEKTTFAKLPLCFEAGTANYIGAIGLAEAIRFLADYDLEEAEKREQELVRVTTEALLKMEGVKIYGTQKNKCAIVSFNVEGIHPLDLGMILDTQGVAIRTGQHCAEPTMAHFGVQGMCRASFGIYNTMDDVEAFIKALERAISILR